MPRIVILPYKAGSRSAKALSTALGVRRLIPDPEKTKFVARNNDVVINWGNGRMVPKVRTGATMYMLNNHTAVSNASNKLTAFQLFHNAGVSIPEFTTSRDIAARWLTDKECKRVFCRTVLSGHSGRGIVIARDANELAPAPLYVKGIPKAEEYRIHVMRDTVFDRQQKRARQGIREELGDAWESGVRSHANGWVFTRSDVNPGEVVERLAVQAITALGLDFGAVDICVTKKGVPYVLEINTSPGLEGTTLDNYTQTFKKVLDL